MRASAQRARTKLAKVCISRGSKAAAVLVAAEAGIPPTGSPPRLVQLQREHHSHHQIRRDGIVDVTRGITCYLEQWLEVHDRSIHVTGKLPRALGNKGRTGDKIMTPW